MHLSNQSLFVILLVGIVAGWLAGKAVRGTGSELSAISSSGSLALSSAIGCCPASASIWVLEWLLQSSTQLLGRYCCCSL